MKRFKDRVALITGAGSGIGRATAIRFAEEGARVVLADLNVEGLEDTVTALPTGAWSLPIELDVSDPGSCQSALTACESTLGRLDVLCNIAGVVLSQHMVDITDEQWQRVLGVNLNGVFYMCRAAMPLLIANKGNIINMSSSAGLTGQAYNSAYCAAKAGVLMFSKSLALEYAAKGVRVNAVCPGMVKTPLTANFQPPEGADMNLLGKLSPLLDGAEPAEIAAAVCYLASDEARFVTGAALPIDGAQTAG